MKTVNPLTLLLFLLPLHCAALDSDREQPIEIEADHLEVREQENISIYEGNVKLTQGSLNILSDRLIIHFNDANELTLMEMAGQPASFRQLDNEQQEMLGEGLEIDYSASKSVLELRRSALFTHAGDLIKSELIRINTVTNAIQAGGKSSDERVKMVITPRQNPTSDQAPDESPDKPADNN
jgi:lipopolysaccharide export system protein LptA